MSDNDQPTKVKLTIKEKHAKRLEKFKENNAQSICLMNIVTIVISAGMGFGTFYLLLGEGFK